MATKITLNPLSGTFDLVAEAGAQGPAGEGVPTGGTAGQVLTKIDGIDFNTEWTDPAGEVASVNGQTGIVVLDTDDVAEGISNLYFSDTLARTAAVADEINDDVTNIAPSQNAVFEALALKQDAISGSNNTFAGFDNSGEMYSIPGWGINGFAGGAEVLLTKEAVDNSSGTVHRIISRINPTEDSPGTSVNAWQIDVEIDTDDAGFNIGGTGNAVRNLTLYTKNLNKSDMGSLELLHSNFDIGNGTDPISIRGVGYALGFGNVHANVTVDGPLQGYGFQINVDEDAFLEQYVNAFYDAANINCVAENGYSSFSASPNISEIPAGKNYQGFTSNPNIALLSGNSGVSVFSAGGNYAFSGADSYWQGVNINPNITGARYAAGLNVTMDNVTAYAGVSSSLIVQDLTFTFTNPGDNNTYTMEYTTGATAGNEVVGIGGTVITVQIEDGVSTAQQIKDALEANFAFNGAVDVTISGTGSNPQVAFGPSNFTGGVNPGNKQAAFLDGDVQITGSLAFGGALSIGNLNAFASYTVVNGGGNPGSIHTLITAPTVADNTTVANADTLGVNTAALINIGENSVVTSAFIGISALGLPAVLAMKSGSTIDRVSGATFAISLDASATGGTANEVALCRALALPNGVTTVNRLYGYEFNLPFGDPGTDSWGLYFVSGSHNYLNGSLRIGGTPGSDDKVTNSSLAMEIVGNKAMRLPVLTTTERNALTPLEGMVIFNTTTSAMEVYDGSTWV